MTIKEQFKRAYESLPTGYKKRAQQVLGISEPAFSRYVRGEVRNEDGYHSALQAVKQAASEALRVAQTSYDTIKNIEVNDPIIETGD